MTPVSETTLLDIKRFIDHNIHLSELSPEYLARHFKLSLRYLYNLFENEQFLLQDISRMHDFWLHKSRFWWGSIPAELFQK
jgi:AraC-like DNA-binding protein